MNKYLTVLAKRISDGNLPIAYDPYNKADVRSILPTLPASYGIVGRIGTTLIFEVNQDGEEND